MSVDHLVHFLNPRPYLPAEGNAIRILTENDGRYGENEAEGTLSGHGLRCDYVGDGEEGTRIYCEHHAMVAPPSPNDGMAEGEVANETRSDAGHAEVEGTECGKRDGERAREVERANGRLRDGYAEAVMASASQGGCDSHRDPYREEVHDEDFCSAYHGNHVPSPCLCHGEVVAAVAFSPSASSPLPFPSFFYLLLFSSVGPALSFPLPTLPSAPAFSVSLLPSDVLFLPSPPTSAF